MADKPYSMGEEEAKKLAVARVAAARRARARRMTWDGLYQEIAERIFPRYANSFHGTTQTPGSKRADKMVDATGAQGLIRFGAAMEYMLTPRAQKWHRLKSTHPKLNKSKRVQTYFHDVTQRLFEYRYAPKANYASVQAESYLSLGAFGVGSYLVERPRQERLRGLRYKGLSLADIYFEQNFEGIIDKAYRFFKLSARQAEQQFAQGPWGRDVLPVCIRKVLEKHDENPSSADVDAPQFEFVQCIEPRTNVDRDKADYRGMEYASYYASVDEPALLQEDGYRSWPIPINRDVTLPGEVYAYGPAAWALGPMKTLNEQKITILQQGHRVVKPVLLAFDDGVVDSFNLTPGAINPGGVNAQGQPLVRRLEDGGNLAVGAEMMELEKNAINDFFLVTLFQILTENPRMTATEVLERIKEKGALLSPTMGRQQSEGLGPQIERELDLMEEQSLLPPMPPELVEAAGEYQVEYDSPLSRAQRAEEASGFLRLVEMATAYASATQDMKPFRRINFDRALPDLAWILAVPPHYLNDDDEAAAVEEEYRNERAMAQMVEAAPAAAGLLKATQGGKKAA